MSDEHTCLRCGGSPYQPWAYGCEHVTRASLRERLRESGDVGADFAGQESGHLEDHWEGWHRHSHTPHGTCLTDYLGEWEHPTREGAISLVLDALVKREVERIRAERDGPEVRGVHYPDAEPLRVAYRVEIEGWPTSETTNPAHDAGRPCTCGAEDCPTPKPFETGDLVVALAGANVLEEYHGTMWKVAALNCQAVDGHPIMLNAACPGAERTWCGRAPDGGYAHASQIRHATPAEVAEYEATR